MHRKCGRIRTNLNMRSAGAQLGPMKNLPEKGTKGVLYQKIQLRMMIISLGQYSSSPVTAWKNWLINYSSYRNLYRFCNKKSQRIHQDREYISFCMKLNDIFSILMNSSRIFDSYCCSIGKKQRFFVIFLLLPSAAFLLHEEFAINFTFCQMPNLGLEQRIRNKFCLTQ